MQRRLALSLAAIVGVLLALEGLLRVLPVSTATMTGYHLDPEVLTYPPGHRWTTSTGWDLRNVQRLKANNWGFVSDHDFQREPRAVALIGDSYIEASMLAPANRPAAQLEALLGAARPIYGLGSPGTALIDHAQRLRLAAERFEVNDFVIFLERGDVRQTLCGSGNVHSRCLDPATLIPRNERQPSPSALKRWARHSALAQYLFGQIKLQPMSLLRSVFVRVVPAEPPFASGASAKRSAPGAVPEPDALALVDVAVDRFFADASPYMKGRLLFVVDGRRDGPSELPTVDDLERRHLIERLTAHGATVIDLEPVYAQHARRSSRRLEVGPYDRHLNALGVTVAMRPVADWLQADGHLTWGLRQ